MYTVYLRTNTINGKQYVGQTGDFKERQMDWRGLKYSYTNHYIDDDRAKYGLDSFTTVVLAEVETEEESLELEKKFIKELNTLYPQGYNICEGGKGRKAKHTEEAKRKMSEARKGENNSMYGKPKTDEWKEKVSKKNKNSLKCGSKPVIQIDKNTNVAIAEFPSMSEVERQLGLSFQNISCCCRGITKSAYGFKWKYKKVS